VRIRCYLRPIRQSLALSIDEVAARTGLAKGEISMIERGHSVPRDDQLESLRSVYGDPGGWYPPTVARALLRDLADCPGCGDELEPWASGARRYHDDSCRAAARRAGGQPPPVR
jgi:transcriptional regulator with XRE-family HTH domain